MSESMANAAYQKAADVASQLKAQKEKLNQMREDLEALKTSIQADEGLTHEDAQKIVEIMKKLNNKVINLTSETSTISNDLSRGILRLESQVAILIQRESAATITNQFSPEVNQGEIDKSVNVDNKVENQQMNVGQTGGEAKMETDSVETEDDAG